VHAVGNVTAPWGRRVVTAVLCLAAVAGCTTQQAVTHVPLSVPADAETLVQALSARRAGLHSLRTLARIVYTSQGTSRRAKQVILAARPDRLRWEILSPFGTVFVLTSSGGMIAAYARGENALYRGRASSENLARYTGVDLPVPLAVDLLLGTPPFHAGGLTKASREEGLLKLWQSKNDAVSVIWFDMALDPVRYEQHDSEGYVVVRAKFANVTEVQGARLPARLTIELPPSQRKVEIELLDPEINPELVGGLFALQTPPGSTEIDIDRVVH